MYKELDSKVNNLRKIFVGFDSDSKNYATEDRAIAAAEKHADSLIGCCTCRIVPFEGRFYPMFFCFSEEQDMLTTAMKGFHSHR